MRRRKLTLMAAAFVAAGPWFGAGTAPASTATAQDGLEEVRQRIKERYRDLFKLKVDGRIGETFTGYLAFVADVYREDDVADLVARENRDREQLYELLAARLRASVEDERKKREITPQVVARRNARREFEDARAFEFLRRVDGVWVCKRDEAAYRRVLELKTEGSVGERADGYLAVRDDVGEARTVVTRENDRRREFYRRIAEAAGVPAESIAADYGRAHFEAARDDDWLLTAAGTWVKANDRAR